MNRENTRRLVESFPDLYQGYKLGPQESCMAFGFECGDGWFDILFELSLQLEPLDVIASQVKEKYGTLRFYVHNATDEAWDLIDEAELTSARTCEICGEPGEEMPGVWVRVRCERCDREKR